MREIRRRTGAEQQLRKTGPIATSPLAWTHNPMRGLINLKRYGGGNFILFILKDFLNVDCDLNLNEQGDDVGAQRLELGRRRFVC
jgi:hypothetical protein